MMKLVTEEQQAGGLMMSLPVFCGNLYPNRGNQPKRVEKPSSPLVNLHKILVRNFFF